MTAKISSELSSPLPDYGYSSRSLQIERTTYGREESQTPLDISFDEMDASPEATIPPHEKIVRAAGGVAIEYLLLSPVGPSGKLNINLMGFGGANANEITQDALRYHRAHNPDSTIFHLNPPAQGDSSALPRSMSRAIASTGSFEQQGEAYAKVLAPYLEDFDEVNIAGHSYGGRQAIALAAALDKPVENLHLLDAPGSRKLGLVGIAKAFMSLEGKHAALYNEHAPDTHAADIQRQGDSHGKQDLLQLWQNGGLLQQFIDQPLAMSKASLEKDLSAAAPNVRNTIKFSSPALSELNHAEDVSLILRRIATADLLIQHDIIQRHTHGLIASNPNILAYLQRFE